MQFVAKGPEIPERLLQLHEEGEVVFFCGAGISFPAGLPGFAELVEQLYNHFGVKRNPIQQTAMDDGRYDEAIKLLEDKVQGGRSAVRKKLAGILKPKKNITGTHKALLDLSKSKDGKTRLVTTNFDRLFEKVINPSEVKSFQAPELPIPEKRWNGIVYLHGLLSDDPQDDELDSLVFSSGDFGLAYLTKGWAARFVSELFRSFTVCFIGYSLNDLVLRYIVDADRLLGESTREIFAFASFSNGEQEEEEKEWRAKSVTPILYPEDNNHASFHNALDKWAKDYRDGVLGKERIVNELASSQPQASADQNNIVGRLLWAISDASGLPAKHFAELNPVPSLDWLWLFIEHRDSYLADTLMALVNTGGQSSRWDTRTGYLANWLLRHLDDERLLQWFVEQGGQLHEHFAYLIEQRLNELAELEGKHETDKLDSISLHAPNAIPCQSMRTLWQLLLARRVRPWQELSLFGWSKRFQLYGLTGTLRVELRNMLTPQVRLSPPTRFPTASEEEKTRSISDLVAWDVMLSSAELLLFLDELDNDENWKKVLPTLFTCFNELLREALDLMDELGGADDRYDHFYVLQRSISEHSQNNDFTDSTYSTDWIALIKLTHDAWCALAKQDPQKAIREAENWMDISYPLFRRLAFFAAAELEEMPCRQKLDWLLTDESLWLWSLETEREVMRLLVVLAPELDEKMLIELAQAILKGPPPEMFEKSIDDKQQAESWMIWQRLAKIKQSGAVLSKDAQATLEQLSAQYKEWKLSDNESDEFPVWTEVGFLESFRIPRRRKELVAWLKNNNMTSLQPDDWRQLCQDDFPTTACTLLQLANEGCCFIERWQQALQAWSDEKHAQRSWRYMAKVITNVPDEKIKDLAHSISQWLEAIAPNFMGQEREFFSIVERILELDDLDNLSTNDPVTQAINHPVGLVTRALLSWWNKGALEEGQGLPNKLKTIFTSLCDTGIEKYRHGRLLLAAYVMTLFSVDEDWTERYLLPLLDWQKSKNEARIAWEGFLCSPQLYRPLMRAMKTEFLDTAMHYQYFEENDSAQKYAALLLFVALDPGNIFTEEELRDATCSLSHKGREITIHKLCQGLEAADNKRDHWDDRVKSYLLSIWPKIKEYTSEGIAEQLGRLCVAAGENFPEAFEILHLWLEPIVKPILLITRLYQADICKDHPSEALKFLALIIGNKEEWKDPLTITHLKHSKLRGCLEQIKQSKPELVETPEYKELFTYIS